MKTRNIPTLLAAIIDGFNRTGFRSHLRIATAVSLVAAGLVSAILTLALSSTASSARPAGPPVIGYDQMQALTTSIEEFHRLHAFWLLDGLGALDDDTLGRGLVQESDPRVQEHLVRLAEMVLDRVLDRADVHLVAVHHPQR